MAQPASFEPTPCPPAQPSLSLVPDDLRAPLEDLRRARAALEEATNRWQSAGLAAQQAVRHCFSTVCGEDALTPPALGLMEALYWDFPEIGSVCIAEAFGLDGAYQVYGLVAPHDESATEA